MSKDRRIQTTRVETALRTSASLALARIIRLGARGAALPAAEGAAHAAIVGEGAGAQRVVNKTRRRAHRERRCEHAPCHAHRSRYESDCPPSSSRPMFFFFRIVACFCEKLAPTPCGMHDDG